MSLVRILGHSPQRLLDSLANRRVKAPQVTLGGTGELDAPGRGVHSSSRIASSSDTVRPAATSARPSGLAFPLVRRRAPASASSGLRGRGGSRAPESQAEVERVMGVLPEILAPAEATIFHVARTEDPLAAAA